MQDVLLLDECEYIRDLLQRRKSEQEKRQALWTGERLLVLFKEACEKPGVNVVVEYD